MRNHTSIVARDEVTGQIEPGHSRPGPVDTADWHRADEPLHKEVAGKPKPDRRGLRL